MFFENQIKLSRTREVKSRCVFKLPFGEELFAGTGGRTTAQGYTASDNVRQKFTQKERDNETGLDYFGARYFSSTQRRFTGVDPAPIKKRHLFNPQDLNRYSYVANNPLAFIDPDGEEKIRVILRTFIPDKTVSIPSAKTLFGMPTPIPSRRTFEGDGRGVGQKGSYRTELVVTIETDPSRSRGSACGRACLSSDGIAGVTREIMSDGSKIQRTASGDTLKGTAEYSSDLKLVNINAKGNESNPLVSGSPGITHDINISVQSFGSRDDVIVHVQGDHDGFPGYEVLIQRPEAKNKSEQLVVGYNPNDEKENALALFPPMDKKMYATRKIKP